MTVRRIVLGGQFWIRWPENGRLYLATKPVAARVFDWTRRKFIAHGARRNRVSRVPYALFISSPLSSLSLTSAKHIYPIKFVNRGTIVHGPHESSLADFMRRYHRSTASSRVSSFWAAFHGNYVRWLSSNSSRSPFTEGGTIENQRHESDRRLFLLWLIAGRRHIRSSSNIVYVCAEEKESGSYLTRFIG